jgi:hypothetical protein
LAPVEDLPPPPPPAELIVLKVETLPLAPIVNGGELFAAPPAPTAIGKPVAVTVILFPGVEYPSSGLAV